MVRVHLGKIAPVLPRNSTTPSSSPAAFFSPSYRTLTRPTLATTSTTSCRTADNARSMRRCSFSSGAAGSSSKFGSGPRVKSTTAANKLATAQTQAQTPGSPHGARSHATPNGLSATPHAPVMPHATRELVALDSFFALGRPLLELPIRLTQRRSTSQTTTMHTSSLHTTSNTVEQDISEGLEALELGEEELVMDLAEDGKTPTGEVYIVRLGPTQPSEALKSAEEEREIELRKESEAAEEDEATLAELEQQNSDPYDAWLIGEPEGLDFAPNIARYLASHPPFSVPQTPSPVNIASPASHHSPQTAADLSFLRPHSPPLPATNTPILASQFANPMTPSGAKQQADRFLSSASLTHRWHAQHDYVQHVSEPLEVARRSYAGLSSGGRRRFDQERKRGEVRMWSEQDGWTTVNLGRSGSGSPFLPAEMVDLDWEDEQAALRAESGGVSLDSTKRKRKKKITKHKYKKRRKAQRALRQRLGK